MHHEHFNVISISFVYAHPIEYTVGNIVPLLAPIKMFGNRMHAVTTILWSIFRIVSTLENHSGYDFECSPLGILPFTGIPEAHNHHHSKNIGDYGSFSNIWDIICNTKEYDKS